MQHGVMQFKPVAGVGQGLGALEQPHDNPQRFIHPLALALGINTEHDGIGSQGPGANAQDDPTTGQVVQEHHTVGHH